MYLVDEVECLWVTGAKGLIAVKAGCLYSLSTCIHGKGTGKWVHMIDKDGRNRIYGTLHVGWTGRVVDV